MARPRYTPKLVLEALAGDRMPRQVAKAYGVHPNLGRLWKRRSSSGRRKSSPKTWACPRRHVHPHAEAHTPAARAVCGVGAKASSAQCPPGARWGSKTWSGSPVVCSRTTRPLPWTRDEVQIATTYPEGGRIGLVEHRSLDPGHAGRAQSRPRQMRAAWARTTRPGQDHADVWSRGGRSWACGLGNRESVQRAARAPASSVPRPATSRDKCGAGSDIRGDEIHGAAADPGFKDVEPGPRPRHARDHLVRDRHRPCAGGLRLQAVVPSCRWECVDG